MVGNNSYDFGEDPPRLGGGVRPTECSPSSASCYFKVLCDCTALNEKLMYCAKGNWLAHLSWELTLLHTCRVAVWRRRKRKNNAFAQHHLAVVWQHLKHRTREIAKCRTKQQWNVNWNSPRVVCWWDVMTIITAKEIWR